MYGRPVHAVRCSVHAAGCGAAGPRMTRHCLLHRRGSERGRDLGRDQVGWAQQVVGPRLSPTSTVAFSVASDATACVFSVWQLGLERRHCYVSQLLPKGTVGIPGPDPSLCGSCLPRAALLSRLERGWLFKQEAVRLPGGFHVLMDHSEHLQHMAIEAALQPRARRAGVSWPGPAPPWNVASQAPAWRSLHTLEPNPAHPIGLEFPLATALSSHWQMTQLLPALGTAHPVHPRLLLSPCRCGRCS